MKSSSKVLVVGDNWNNILRFRRLLGKKKTDQFKIYPFSIFSTQGLYKSSDWPLLLLSVQLDPTRPVSERGPDPLTLARTPWPMGRGSGSRDLGSRGYLLLRYNAIGHSHQNDEAWGILHADHSNSCWPQHCQHRLPSLQSVTKQAFWCGVTDAFFVSFYFFLTSISTFCFRCCNLVRIRTALFTSLCVLIKESLLIMKFKKILKHIASRCFICTQCRPFTSAFGLISAFTYLWYILGKPKFSLLLSLPPLLLLCFVNSTRFMLVV